MKLYRGDNIFNKFTRPGQFRSNGLWSKAFGGGSDPENIERKGLLETISAHIKPQLDGDKNYYDVSDYISFSTSRERALYWCKNRDTLILAPAAEFEETRYLFTVDIDEVRLVANGSGMYYYYFNCNSKLKTSDKANSNTALCLNSIFNNQICPTCENTRMTHAILLINPYEYVSANGLDSKYQGAIQFAKQDSEWLLLPLDAMGSHRVTRIPRADFWSAELYKVIGEQRSEAKYMH